MEEIKWVVVAWLKKNEMEVREEFKGDGENVQQ